MNNKNIYILALILIVLLAIAYILTSEKGDKTSTYKLEEKLFALDSAKVDKIEVIQKGKKVVLVKNENEWRTIEPVDSKAYQQFVLSAISDLKNFELESIVSTNNEKKDAYGFNDTASTLVSVYESGQLKGSFLIGNSASGPNTAYIKKSDGNEIFLANRILKSNFVKENLNDWRDKQIVSILPGTIDEVEFNLSGEVFKVERDSSGKYFMGKDTVNNDKFGSFVGALQSYHTQSFRDTTLSSETKFDCTIKVKSLGNETLINFLKLDINPVKYLIKVTGSNFIYEVDEAQAKKLLKTKKELMEK